MHQRLSVRENLCVSLLRIAVAVEDGELSSFACSREPYELPKPSRGDLLPLDPKRHHRVRVMVVTSGFSNARETPIAWCRSTTEAPVSLEELWDLAFVPARFGNIELDGKSMSPVEALSRAEQRERLQKSKSVLLKVVITSAAAAAASAAVPDAAHLLKLAGHDAYQVIRALT
jgi:hypothetical protein